MEGSAAALLGLPEIVITFLKMQSDNHFRTLSYTIQHSDSKSELRLSWSAAPTTNTRPARNKPPSQRRRDADRSMKWRTDQGHGVTLKTSMTQTDSENKVSEVTGCGAQNVSHENNADTYDQSCEDYDKPVSAENVPPVKKHSVQKNQSSQFPEEIKTRSKSKKSEDGLCPKETLRCESGNESEEEMTLDISVVENPTLDEPCDSGDGKASDNDSDDFILDENFYEKMHTQLAAIRSKLSQLNVDSIDDG